MLGTLLITGMFSSPVAILNVLTFIVFLGAKIRLATKDPDAECGCFGRQQRASIDAASLATSIIFVFLALFNLAFATANSVPPTIRFTAFACHVAYSILCMTNILKRRHVQFGLKM